MTRFSLKKKEVIINVLDGTKMNRINKLKKKQTTYLCNILNSNIFYSPQGPTGPH